jgi:hypothetical protein
MPFAKTAAEFARGKQVGKRLEDALKQPANQNLLRSSVNRMAP